VPLPECWEDLFPSAAEGESFYEVVLYNRADDEGEVNNLAYSPLQAADDKKMLILKLNARLNILIREEALGTLGPWAEQD